MRRVRTDEDINKFVCSNLVNGQFSALGDSRGTADVFTNHYITVM